MEKKTKINQAQQVKKIRGILGQIKEYNKLSDRGKGDYIRLFNELEISSSKEEILKLYVILSIKNSKLEDKVDNLMFKLKEK